MNKDKDYYLLVAATIILLALFFAYMDIKGMWMIEKIGGYSGDNYTKLGNDYMDFFWTFANTMIFLASTAYYYFRRDLSEALAIMFGSILMLWGGLEDVLYYALQGISIPEASPWLWELPNSIGSRILGYDTVTPTGLIFNLIIFTTITVLMVRYLRKHNKNILGIKT